MLTTTICVTAKCIDYYTQQRIALADDSSSAKPIDPRLEAIVNRMFQRCLDDGQYRQAFGLAIETHRMDIFEASITQSDDIPGMLSYAFKVKKRTMFIDLFYTMIFCRLP